MAVRAVLVLRAPVQPYGAVTQGMNRGETAKDYVRCNVQRSLGRDLSDGVLVRALSLVNNEALWCEMSESDARRCTLNTESAWTIACGAKLQAPVEGRRLGRGKRRRPRLDLHKAVKYCDC